MDSLIVTFVVHGIVQDVGYRAFVKSVAEKLELSGAVKNCDDGSVVVVVEGGGESIRKFEKNINVSTSHGVQVMKIDRHNGSILPECSNIAMG